MTTSGPSGATPVGATPTSRRSRHPWRWLALALALALIVLAPIKDSLSFLAIGSDSR